MTQRRTFDLRRDLDGPFLSAAVELKIPLTLRDIEYFRDVVQPYPATRLIYISENYGAQANPADAGTRLTDEIMDSDILRRIVLCEHFYHDPRCPRGARLIFWTLMGWNRAQLMSRGTIGLLDMRRACLMRWMETCRRGI